MQRHLFVPILIATLLAGAPAEAQSVSIEDQPGGARLDVEDLPLDQAVDALARHFRFTFKILRPSGTRLSGSRTGSSLELLNWVLTGHDRAIFVDDGQGRGSVTRVVVYGPSGGAPPPQPRQRDDEAMDPMTPDGPSIDDFPPDSSGSELEGNGPPLNAGMGETGGEGAMEMPPQ